MPTPYLAVKLIRRGIPTAELLQDVYRVASELRTDRLSAHRYTQLGRFNATTVIRRFGSWARALHRLGLRPAHLFHVGEKNALDDLRRVARQLNSTTVTVADYRAHGRFTPDTLRKLHGPWHRALHAAGLQPHHYRGLSDPELFDNLKKRWHQLNRQPRMQDLQPPDSICTVGPYLTRFGTWTNALRAFDASLHPDQATSLPLPPRKEKTVTTHINWRLRYQILQRDNFRCCACGKSPATHPGIALQIDHKHPRSQGGPSTEENLQTLCNLCNGGKGDLL
jgi:hypothetical protein